MVATSVTNVSSVMRALASNCSLERAIVEVGAPHHRQQIVDEKRHLVPAKKRRPRQRCQAIVVGNSVGGDESERFELRLECRDKLVDVLFVIAAHIHPAIEPGEPTAAL